jgi:hypothetical protein
VSSLLFSPFFGKCKGNKILIKISSEAWCVKFKSVLKALVSVLQSTDEGVVYVIWPSAVSTLPNLHGEKPKRCHRPRPRVMVSRHGKADFEVTRSTDVVPLVLVLDELLLLCSYSSG